MFVTRRSSKKGGEIPLLQNRGEGDDLPEGWHLSDVQSLIIDIQNGFSKRASSVGKETVVLRLADIVNKTLSLTKLRKIKMSFAEIEKKRTTKK